MRARLGTALLVACICLAGGPLAAAADDTEQRVAKAREVAKGFMTRLKGELVAAIKSGGPQSAIPVCHTAAPAIATAQSDAHGLEVGRTALKLRNPKNAPDDWERQVLESFVAKRAAGADPKTLEYYEVTTRDGKRVFRYMKAIPTGKPCLACHGSSVAPELAAKIKEFYPEDAATGFKLGDIRGAFTIVQPLDR